MDGKGEKTTFKERKKGGGREREKDRVGERQTDTGSVETKLRDNVR